MKLGLFADGIWGLNVLKLILNNKSIKLKFICLRYHETDSFLRNYAKKKKIKIFRVKNVNSNNFIKKIKKFKVDLLASMSYDQIFSKNFLKNFFVINCHAGLLPAYRGRNPINWAIINGEKYYGVTTHIVDEKIDTGNLILQKKFRIFKSDNYATILKKTYKRCAKILFHTIILILKKGKNLKTIDQNSLNKKSSYYFKRKKGDEIINTDSNAREIINFVKALVYPGPYAIYNLNNKRIKIKNVSEIKYKGKVKKKISKNFAIIKCKDKFIKLNFLK